MRDEPPILAFLGVAMPSDIPPVYGNYPRRRISDNEWFSSVRRRNLFTSCNTKLYSYWNLSFSYTDLVYSKHCWTRRIRVSFHVTFLLRAFISHSYVAH